MEKVDITPDSVLSDKDFRSVSHGIRREFVETKTIFESLKDSCKRSRNNFTTLTKDLFRALLGKKKKNKK